MKQATLILIALLCWALTTNLFAFYTDEQIERMSNDTAFLAPIEKELSTRRAQLPKGFDLKQHVKEYMQKLENLYRTKSGIKPKALYDLRRSYDWKVNINAYEEFKKRGVDIIPNPERSIQYDKLYEDQNFDSLWMLDNLRSFFFYSGQVIKGEVIAIQTYKKDKQRYFTRRYSVKVLDVIEGKHKKGDVVHFFLDGECESSNSLYSGAQNYRPPMFVGDIYYYGMSEEHFNKIFFDDAKEYSKDKFYTEKSSYNYMFPLTVFLSSQQPVEKLQTIRTEIKSAALTRRFEQQLRELYKINDKVNFYLRSYK